MDFQGEVWLFGPWTRDWLLSVSWRSYLDVEMPSITLLVIDRSISRLFRQMELTEDEYFYVDAEGQEAGPEPLAVLRQMWNERVRG